MMVPLLFQKHFAVHMFSLIEVVLLFVDEQLTLSHPWDVNYVLGKSTQSAVRRNLRFR